jgi:hypothetical protein
MTFSLRSAFGTRRRAAGVAVLVFAVVVSSLAVWAWGSDRGKVRADQGAARGATMPYTTYEAEDGQAGGGAQVVGPNRTVGDIAGEASGRRAVTLGETGAYVQWTSRAPTNTLVARFSIPDGTDSSLNVYVGRKLSTTLRLTSRFAWLYGEESAPTNTPASGAPRHIYDEANVLLAGVVPTGSAIRLQKDADNPGTIAVDFVDLEQATQVTNPDPAKYAVPHGYTQQAVQDALDRARQDVNLAGVYLPAGDYQTTGKFQVYGRSVRVIGAGPWFSRFHAPDNLQNTDVGMAVQSTAGGSLFANFAYFGNYRSRVDGPGRVFDLQNVSSLDIDNIWTEHQVVFVWGQNTDNSVIENSRIRDMFADGITMTNGSTNNRVLNDDARATGDDSFALFAATDASGPAASGPAASGPAASGPAASGPAPAGTGAGGSDESGNIFENLSSRLSWRAAGVAVYGGTGNTFRNLYIADTLTYSGVTVSSFDFGVPMDGFGAIPPTTFDGISVVRSGGHFWGNQTFPAIWMFSASKPFQGIRFTNVDVIDPTYSGVMFQTNVVNSSTQNPVTDTQFTGLSISGARKSGDQFDANSGYGILVLSSAVGSATFANLRLSGNMQDVRNDSPTFALSVGTAPPALLKITPPPATPIPTTLPPTTATATLAPSTTAPRTKAPPSSVPPSVDNLARGRSVVESGHVDNFVGKNITDGSATSYWEGPRDKFPSTLTVDLHSSQRVGRLTLALPPLTVWTTRRQVIAVLGSADGSHYTTLAAPQSYTFDPLTGNRSTASVSGSARYLRLEFRSNSGWPAAQLSELGVFTS